MSFLKYLNPLYPFIRAKDDVGASFKGVYSSIAEARRVYAAKKAKEEGKEAALKGDPAVRFSDAVEAGSWTEDDINNQINRFRTARRIFVVSSYILTPCFVAFGLFMPWWMSMFIVPSALFFFVFLLMLAAKHAWFEWQILSRSFLPFREFASLPNFISKVMVP